VKTPRLPLAVEKLPIAAWKDMFRRLRHIDAMNASPPKTRRTRLSFSAIAGVFILGLLIVNMGVMMRHSLRQVPTYDFLAFYAAGLIVSEFGPSKLYDLETEREVHRSIEPLTDRRPLWAYLNPPFVALLLAPLASLPYEFAYRLLLPVNLMLFIGAILIATRGYPREMRLACILGGLATVPAYYAFYNGQLVCLLLLLFALFVTDLRTGRDRRAGIWLGLMLIKPQLLIAPVLLLVWKRRSRTLVVAAGVAVLLGVVSLAMIGAAGARDYRQTAVMSAMDDRSLAFFAETMHNWRGFFLRAGMGEWSAPATAMASVLTIAALLWMWRGDWDPSPCKLIALIFATLLVSPHCHDHDFILAGLALALLASAVKEPSTLWLWATTFALATWALPSLLSFASPPLASRISILHAIGVTALVITGFITTSTARQEYRSLLPRRVPSGS